MKQTSAMRPADDNPIAPKPWLSHNILLPDQTVPLAPLAAVRASGQLHNTAKSAVRALDIVELLGRSATPLRAFEIAGATGLSPSSVDQLLKTLVDSCYLIFDPASKFYHVSPRLAAMGAALTSFYFPENRLEAFAAAVQADLQRTITVLCSQGTFLHAVLRNPNDGISGLRLPVLGSSSGAAWLAAQSDDIVSATIERCRRELEDVKRDTQRILAAIERVRREGYAIGGLTIENGLCGIGVALPPARNGVILVVSVTAPVAELKERQGEFMSVIKQRMNEHLIEFGP